MLIGDAATWISRFKSFDTRLLQRLHFVWPSVQSVLEEQPEEDVITLNLVVALSKDEKIRRICHWLEFQFEPAGYKKTGAAYSKGKIDIAVFLDQTREVYLAYECKRLNVRHNGRRSSLATPYVSEGVMRFVTEQYAERLPMGCMLGYVIDGDVAFALKRVKNAIQVNKASIFLISGPSPTKAVQSIERFSTTHERPASSSHIQVLHALLPCVTPTTRDKSENI